MYQNIWFSKQPIGYNLNNLFSTPPAGGMSPGAKVGVGIGAGLGAGYLIWKAIEFFGSLPICGGWVVFRLSLFIFIIFVSVLSLTDSMIIEEENYLISQTGFKLYLSRLALLLSC